MSTQDVRVEALLNIRCIVKGYHICRFEVKVSEVFTANKKRRERGNAFKVVNHRGRLGHLQPELVDPFWPLHADIFVLVNYFIIIIFFFIETVTKNPGKQLNMKLFKTHTLLFWCTVLITLLYLLLLLPEFFCQGTIQLLSVFEVYRLAHETNF